MARLGYIERLLVSRLGSPPEWEFVAVFRGENERAPSVEREITLASPKAKVRSGTTEEGIYLCVDTPRFIPERFLELMAKKYGCVFLKIDYIG